MKGSVWMNDKQLRSFVDIVETKSFSKSEENLFLSRQALKKQIDSLENELGFPLLIRHSKGIAPTAQGEQFYHYAKDLLQTYSNTVDMLRSTLDTQNLITIGSPLQPNHVLEPVFSLYAKEYPHVKQNFKSVSSRHRVTSVLDGTVDVIESIMNSEFDCTKLGKLKLIDLNYRCFMNPDHPLASKEKLTVYDLDGYDLDIRFDGNEGIIREIQDACKYVNFTPVEGNETEIIFNSCFNGHIYVTRTYYSTTTGPTLNIPLESDYYVAQYLIYRLEHTQAVSDFIECTKKIFPEG